MREISKRKVLLAVGDTVLAIGIFQLGYFLRLGGIVNILKDYTGATLFCVLALLVSLHIFDLYDYRQHGSLRQYLPSLVRAMIAALALSVAFFYFSNNWRFGRGAFLISLPLLAPSLALWRKVAYRLTRAARPKRVAIVGTGASAREIYDTLSTAADQYDIVGFVSDDETQSCHSSLPAVVLGSRALERPPGGPPLDWIVLAEQPTDIAMRRVLAGKMAGAEVFAMPTLYEELNGKLPVEHMSDDWLVLNGGFDLLHNHLTQRLKRLIDLSVAVCGLLVSAPLWLLVGVAIKIDDGGKVLYRQRRVGKNGSVFQVVKFRSMRPDAESLTGAVWADDGDSRITRVGHLIRKLRIDEIPQMWNVLKGEMSFVGPRPERPEFVATLSDKIPYYSLRHLVEPGITGWAQIRYHYGGSVEDALEKLKYDLYYIRHVSVLMDLQIILSTVRVVLRQIGGR